MGTEMALREDEHTSGSMRLKLVKGVLHYGEPASFSDTNHNRLKMFRFGHPHAINVSDEVAHLLYVQGFLILYTASAIAPHMYKSAKKA